MRKIFIIPSLLTTTNFICGFLSIIFTLEGRYTLSAGLILFGILLDIFDGKVAAITSTSTQFGKEYDSLADAVTFCVSPAVLLYKLFLIPYLRAGIVTASIFAICGILRLARFNTQGTPVAKKFFIGLPTPAAAGTIVSTIILVQKYHVGELFSILFIAGPILLGYLMISHVKYPRDLLFDFKAKKPFINLVIIIFLGATFVLFPRQALFVAFNSYTLFGGLVVRRSRVVVLEEKLKVQSA
jgi:CDP-diacylglycerol--serine O-phosphatidyltransferase